MPSPSNHFTIQINNVINCNTNCDKSATIPASSLIVPQNILPGAPPTLTELVRMVGPNAVSISYYAKATGSVSSHDCWATHAIYAYGKLDDDTKTNQIALAKTSNNPASGGSINGDWIALASNTSSVINKLYTEDKCTGSGCWCRFESKGGWSDVKIDLRIDVVVDLLSYCTIGNNIHGDMCYNYIGDYIVANGATQKISTYMKEYCNAKYPGESLAMFNDNGVAMNDPKDYQICACNMPDEEYKKFFNSVSGLYPEIAIGSISPNCLFPACVNSSFKGAQLGGCPIPQCFANVTIKDSDIGGDINITQTNDCTSYGVTTQNTNDNDKPDVSYTPGSSQSFFEQYKWTIFVLVLLMVILIIAVIFYVVKTNKTPEV